MHIVLGVLSAVAGLIWAIVALQRSGFDPASLNPFLWYRRSQWRKKERTADSLREIDDLPSPSRLSVATKPRTAMASIAAGDGGCSSLPCAQR